MARDTLSRAPARCSAGRCARSVLARPFPRPFAARRAPRLRPGVLQGARATRRGRAGGMARQRGPARAVPAGRCRPPRSTRRGLQLAEKLPDFSHNDPSYRTKTTGSSVLTSTTLSSWNRSQQVDYYVLYGLVVCEIQTKSCLII